MRKAALTGGIATGKSYVLQRLQQRGIPCLDADELAHGVTAAGTEATAAIAARFGAAVLDADGAVDRRKVGSIVFVDAEARRDLERIVHPAVYRAIAAGIRAFELTDHAPVVVVDVPLLYETGHEGDFDVVIATVCSPELQVQRLVARGLSEREAAERLAAQMPAAQKAARADYTIRTDGSFAETDTRVDSILKLLLQ